ncbi:MAG: hypothetical protein ACE5IP_08515 [Terriglobia bacterium]
MVARRALQFLGTVGVATASCFLAYLVVSFFIFEWPRLLLAAFTDIELLGLEARRGFVYMAPRILPRTVTDFPVEGSALLYALYQSGSVLWGAALVWLAAGTGRHARGWLRLFLLQIIFWPTVLLGLYSAVMVGGHWGPLNAALRVLWPEQANSLAVRLPLGILIAACFLAALHLSLRSFLDSVAETRFRRLLALGRWLVLPATLVGFALHLPLLRYWGLFVVAFVLGPALLALLAGLPGALAPSRPAPPLRPSFTGAVALLLTLGFVTSGLWGYDKLSRRAGHANFSSYESRYWRLQIESPTGIAIAPEAVAAEADRRLTGLAARLGLQPPNPGLRAHYHSSTESKRALAGDDRPFTLDIARSEVHHLLSPDGQVSDARGDALLLMHSAWGEPGSAAVAQALARYAVGNFHGAPLADYASRITREEQPYSLRDIFGLKSDYLSPLVRDALGGAWVEFIVDSKGQELLATLYRAPLVSGREDEFARKLSVSWEELERDWREHLRGATERASRPPPARPPEGFFHRGISFSHEGGGSYGYGSDRAQAQLARIRKLGANSTAIVPYAFTRAPQETRIRFRTDESDDRVIRTVRAARALGLRTMLKPQLWGPGFTGHIVFEHEADFERWFALYRRWLLHYARLAELYGVDVLVIGTELGGLTRHEAAWRALIADLRRVYRGPLTYAANWGAEFEELRFWDALDYLGVNMYYPLAAAGETPQAESARVQERIELFARMAQQYGKPVLFTEVGYPATVNAATEPWKEDGGALDPALQARCYATVFEAFYRQPWFAGLYWWKWPSHGRGNRYNASYNPLGKPALEVIARWYGPGAAREEIGGRHERRYTHPSKGEGQ